jgi:hypothetical protein|tara:strand:- start:3388 stop:3630 length:243 start_codon:yes stop_codon:yes gene_type:complete
MYNGFKNYQIWNISLWFNNDYDIYQTIMNYLGQGFTKKELTELIVDKDLLGSDRTKDGVKYTKLNVFKALKEFDYESLKG